MVISVSYPACNITRNIICFLIAGIKPVSYTHLADWGGRAGTPGVQGIHWTMDSRNQNAHYCHETPMWKPSDELDKRTSAGTGKDQPLYGTGSLLCPQWAYRERLFCPGNGTVPSGASVSYTHLHLKLGHSQMFLGAVTLSTFHIGISGSSHVLKKIIL